jgi:hypothetical protein
LIEKRVETRRYGESKEMIKILKEINSKKDFINQIKNRVKSEKLYDCKIKFFRGNNK